jgi:outer membrane protein
MKRSLALAVTLASGFALSAAAQTLPAPAPAAVPGSAKIAVIAMQMAVSQTNEFQRNFADLQKKYEPKRLELKTLSDQIDSLGKQLQAQGDKLSDAERANRTKALEDKQKQAKRLAEDAQSGFQGDMQELYNATASKVYEVLANYAQQQQLTLVLDVSQEQTPVLFAVASANITRQITEAYNVKSGVPAPPSAPAAKTPATR